MQADAQRQASGGAVQKLPEHDVKATSAVTRLAGGDRPMKAKAALERAPPERPAFLARACGSDAALRHDVDSLLAAVVDDDFLERPAADAAEHVSNEEDPHRAPPAGTGSRAAEPRSAGA